MSSVTDRYRNRRTNEDLQKEMDADREKSGGAGLPTWKCSDGKNTIRVLPGHFGKSGEKWYSIIQQHWLNVGGKNIPTDCPAEHFGKHCPVCDEVEKQRKIEEELRTVKGSEEQLQLVGNIIRRLLPRTTYCLNIIDRAEANPTVRLYRAPKTVFQVIETAYSNNGPEVLDPDTGNDFYVNKGTKNKRTEYVTSPSTKSTPVADEDMMDGIFESLINLDDQVREPDYEELENQILDAIQDEEDQLREPERPSRPDRSNAKGADRYRQTPRNSQRDDAREDRPARDEQQHERRDPDDEIPMEKTGAQQEQAEPERPASPERPAQTGGDSSPTRARDLFAKVRTQS